MASTDFCACWSCQLVWLTPAHLCCCISIEELYGQSAFCDASNWIQKSPTSIQILWDDWTATCTTLAQMQKLYRASHWLHTHRCFHSTTAHVQDETEPLPLIWWNLVASLRVYERRPHERKNKKFDDSDWSNCNLLLTCPLEVRAGEAKTYLDWDICGFTTSKLHRIALRDDFSAAWWGFCVMQLSSSCFPHLWKKQTLHWVLLEHCIRASHELSLYVRMFVNSVLLERIDTFAWTVDQPCSKQIESKMKLLIFAHKPSSEYHIIYNATRTGHTVA